MKSHTDNPAILAACEAVCRRWPSPALHLRGGKSAVPVEALEPGIRALLDTCTLRVQEIRGRLCVVISY